MTEIINYLKNDIWGLIILGGLGSVFGSILIYVFRKLYFWLAKHYKIFRTKSFFNKIIENYSEGYVAGKAAMSDIHQTILVGRYIINILLHCTVLISILIIGFGLLSFIPFQFYWIVVFVLGIVTAFPIKKIKRNLWLFNTAYEQVFDDKLIKKKALDYLKEEIDKKIKPKSQEKEV